MVLLGVHLALQVPRGLGLCILEVQLLSGFVSRRLDLLDSFLTGYLVGPERKRELFLELELGEDSSDGGCVLDCLGYSLTEIRSALCACVRVFVLSVFRGPPVRMQKMSGREPLTA